MTPRLPDGHERVSRDFARTTGHTLTFSVDSDRREVVIEVDGAVLGGFWRSFPADEASFLAEFVDELQAHSLDEFIWGGWPTCAQHDTHPLQASVRDADAVWICPTDGTAVAPVGELSAIG